MIPFLVLLASGALLFFAVVETAFSLLMRLPQRLEAERETESPALAAYLDDPLRFFLPARIMRGTLLVLIVALLAQAIGQGFPGWLVLFAIGTSITVGVAQVLPPLLVRRQSPERVLEMLLPAFTVFANVLAPLTTMLVEWMGHAPARHQGNGDPTPASRESPSHENRAPSEAGDESRLLRSVVDFGETLVREVMTPRPDIVAIRADATLDDLRQLVREQEYSRLPVFDDNLDNIVGIVVVKDLIQMEPTSSHTVRDMMRPAAFVPETKRVADLLREFRQGRFQLALVVDEYGGTAGLVTVEDVVEELVGEIRDEYDSEAEPIVREADDAYVFSGKVGIGEMTERLGVEIDEDGFETVGGFVLARAGRVPSVGERFEFDGLAVEVLEAERRRIHKVRVRRLPPEPADVVE
jgi:CBS domain containing-hemolysin-like protein